VSVAFERTVEARDAVKLSLGRFNWGKLTRLDKLTDLNQAEIVQVC
jgi:hypothetical protein